MYTRSYPKNEPPKKPEIVLQTEPVQEILSEKAIPEGYCGTAILREKEPLRSVKEAENAPCAAAETSHRPYGRVRKFKVTTKVTPTLWHPENEVTEAPSEETLCQNENTECCKEHMDFKGSDTGGVNIGNSSAKQCYEEKNDEDRPRSKEKNHRRGIKLSNDGKHRFSLTEKVRLKDRSFSLEDLLLGGLILLLLNEGADDDIILIFGFLLFSGL